MSVEWRKPPRGSERNDSWASILNELRTRPGEWARVSTSATPGIASHIKTGKLGKAKPGEFEAISVKGNHTDDRRDIYARYVGESS